jgi:FxsC-like protein
LAFWFFLSYARDKEKRDKDVEEFYEDLREEVRNLEYFPQNGEQPGFRDLNNLALGEEWDPDLRNALQSSRVMVCLISPYYVRSAFCGKEFTFFDQRRRQGVAPNISPPAVIVPVIWAPVRDESPEVIRKLQFDSASFPPRYTDLGLRHFKLNRRQSYRQGLNAIVDAIRKAGREYPNLASIANPLEWRDLTNAFEDKRELPNRTCFVFFAASRNEAPSPSLADSYSLAGGAYWRPFRPPKDESVRELATIVAERRRIHIEEIRADDQLAAALQDASRRNDPILLVIDPWTLMRIPAYQARLKPFDDIPSSSTAIFVAWNPEHPETLGNRDQLVAAVKEALQKKTSAPAARIRMPIQTPDELTAEMERSLAELTLQQVGASADQKPASAAMPLVSGPREQRG